MSMPPDVSGSPAYLVDAPQSVPLRVGERSPVPRAYRIKLDQAATLRKFLTGPATSLHVVGASSQPALARIRLVDQDGDDFPIQLGFGITNVPFDRIFVTNDAQVGEYLDILVSFGALIINPTSLIQSVQVAKPSRNEGSVSIPGTGVQTTIVAANASRERIWLTHYKAGCLLYVSGTFGSIPFPGFTPLLIDPSATGAITSYNLTGVNATVFYQEQLS